MLRRRQGKGTTLPIRAGGFVWTAALGAVCAACVVVVKHEPPPREPAASTPARPAPPPPPAPHVVAAAPPHAAPPPAPAPAPAPGRKVIPLGRIVHPPPARNATAGALDIRGLKLKLRANRRCGPRESTPGHWIHVDCNAYTPITSARPFSRKKINLILSGKGITDGAVQGELDVDHRNDGTEGPIKDQGQVGSCTSLSLSSAMDNAIRRQNKPDTISPIHLWSHYGFPDINTAGNENLNKVIAGWDVWPYDERAACELDQSGDSDCGPYTPPAAQGSSRGDAQLQAKIKDADSKGHWKVTAYDEVEGKPDTLAQYLATGADVWLSMNIGSTWLTLSGDTIADWRSDDVEGGHAFVLAGVRRKNGQRQFLVHNSWGPDWGDKGYAWVSEAMVSQYIKHAYKVTVADTTAPPPPPPAPAPAAPTAAPSPQAPVAPPPPSPDPNALTDDDCAETQLVDSVTGQCADMCSDDSRPANGQCGDGASFKKPVPGPGRAPVQNHH